MARYVIAFVIYVHAKQKKRVEKIENIKKEE